MTGISTQEETVERIERDSTRLGRRTAGSNGSRKASRRWALATLVAIPLAMATPGEAASETGTIAAAPHEEVARVDACDVATLRALLGLAPLSRVACPNLAPLAAPPVAHAATISAAVATPSRVEGAEARAARLDQEARAAEAEARAAEAEAASAEERASLAKSGSCCAREIDARQNAGS